MRSMKKHKDGLRRKTSRLMRRNQFCFYQLPVQQPAGGTGGLTDGVYSGETFQVRLCCNVSITRAWLCRPGLSPAETWWNETYQICVYTAELGLLSSWSPLWDKKETTFLWIVEQLLCSAPRCVQTVAKNRECCNFCCDRVVLLQILSDLTSCFLCK